MAYRFNSDAEGKQRSDLGAHFRRLNLVVLGATHGAKENRIGLSAKIERLLGKWVAPIVICGAAHESEFENELGTDRFKDLDRLGDHFGADSVAGQYCNLSGHLIPIMTRQRLVRVREMMYSVPMLGSPIAPSVELKMKYGDSGESAPRTLTRRPKSARQYVADSIEATVVGIADLSSQFFGEEEVEGGAYNPHEG